MDSRIVQDFIIYRRRDGIGGRSIARNLSVIKQFYRYLAGVGAVNSDPTTGLRAPRYTNRLLAVLDVEQCNQLLDFRCNTPLDVRDKAMFELLYSSGLRVSEVVKLNVEDLDLDDQMLRVVRGKGGYDRDVPFGRKARDAIKRWLETRARIAREGEKALFVGFRYGGRRITPKAVQQRLAYWSVKRLGFRVYPHMLRHSCATHFLEGCGDLRATQELLGHADINSTAIYTHLNAEYLIKVCGAAHPRAKMSVQNPPNGGQTE